MLGISSSTEPSGAPATTPTPSTAAGSAPPPEPGKTDAPKEVPSTPGSGSTTVERPQASASEPVNVATSMPTPPTTQQTPHPVQSPYEPNSPPTPPNAQQTRPVESPPESKGTNSQTPPSPSAQRPLDTQGRPVSMPDWPQYPVSPGQHYPWRPTRYSEHLPPVQETTNSPPPPQSAAWGSGPRNGGDSSPRNWNHSVPRNGGDRVPRNGADSGPRNGGDRVPRNWDHSVPMNGGDSSQRNWDHSVPRNGGDSSPRNGGDSSPRNGSDSGPRDGGDRVPRNWDHSVPMNGGDSSSRNWDHSVPRNGDDSSPRNWDHSVPRNGGDSGPRNGADSVPRNGGDSTPSNPSRPRTESSVTQFSDKEKAYSNNKRSPRPFIHLHSTAAKNLHARLIDTRKEAKKHRDRYQFKAKTAMYLHNAAIFAQVFFGTLVTLLSAIGSGTGKNYSTATAVLGGISTIVASYVAKIRGSNEVKVSTARVKDLDHFIRECDAFILDYGHIMAEGGSDPANRGGLANALENQLFDLRDDLEQLLKKDSAEYIEQNFQYRQNPEQLENKVLSSSK